MADRHAEHRHVIPGYHQVAALPDSGGLHHEYGLVPKAALIFTEHNHYSLKITPPTPLLSHIFNVPIMSFVDLGLRHLGAQA